MFNDRKYIKIAFVIAAIFLMFEVAGYYFGTGDTLSGKKNSSRQESAIMALKTLKAKNIAFRQRLKNQLPREIYIVVDTGKNRLYLKKGEKTLGEAVISSGSGSILEDPAGKRRWVFDTPRGEYQVRTKTIAPAWTRPDWAFIEEGEAIPNDPRKRVEEGVLGDYALGFGNGYFIHGTLYTRLLGRNVTHGCIRMGDKDLKTVYSLAGIGTRIYIF